MKQTILIITFCFFNFSFLLAQDRVSPEYITQANIFAKKAWTSNTEEFKKVNIPAEYLSLSKVIIAQHTEITTNVDPKLKFEGTAKGAVNQIYTEVSRHMILLNDKNAVDEYSEFKFDLYYKNKGGSAFEKTTTYVGVRIIKPSGETIELDPAEIVLEKDDYDFKVGKLAISNLQPGDIIDYFFAYESQSSNDFRTRPYNILLYNSAPIMHISFHAVLNKNYALDYKSYNGADILNVERNDEKEIIVSFSQKNIPPFETDLWTVPELQFAFIRIKIAYGNKDNTRQMALFKPGFINKHNYQRLIPLYYTDEFNYKHLQTCSSFRPQLKYMMSSHGMDDIYSKLNSKPIQKVMYAFYLVRFAKLLSFEPEKFEDRMEFSNQTLDGMSAELYCTLQLMNENPDYLISNKKNSFRLNEAMYTDELRDAVFIPSLDKVISIDNPFSIPFEIPLEMDGLPETRTFDGKSVYLNDFEVKEGPDLTKSAASSNLHLDKLDITIDPEGQVRVKRVTKLSGYYKEYIQRKLIVYEDYYEAERKGFGISMSLIEKLNTQKNQKLVEEVKNAFAEARKNQHEAFLEEAKEWFDLEITDLKDQKTDTLGVRHIAPDFVFSSSFNINGIIKKAGKNLILDVGKLQGEQKKVLEEQRIRTHDIYMEYAKKIQYDFNIRIPEGYVAEGVDELNVNVSNETGYYIVTASQSNDSISISVTKSYLHDFEPVANWDKMLQFLDAANHWYNRKILFKKVD